MYDGCEVRDQLRVESWARSTCWALRRIRIPFLTSGGSALGLTYRYTYVHREHKVLALFIYRSQCGIHQTSCPFATMYQNRKQKGSLMECKYVLLQTTWARHLGTVSTAAQVLKFILPESHHSKQSLGSTLGLHHFYRSSRVLCPPKETTAQNSKDWCLGWKEPEHIYWENEYFGFWATCEWNVM